MKKLMNTIKYDKTVNWEKAKNFIPQLNEIIVYEDTSKIKIGDGKTKVNDLSFYNSDTYELFQGEVEYYVNNDN